MKFKKGQIFAEVVVWSSQTMKHRAALRFSQRWRERWRLTLLVLVVCQFSVAKSFISAGHEMRSRGLCEQGGDAAGGRSPPPPKLLTKPKQKRRQPQLRRPRGYWSDIANVEGEIIRFWTNVGGPPSNAIPSEGLLNHFGRNDLRWAISRHGGREALSLDLGGAAVVPGKWTEAVDQSVEVQKLLDSSHPATKGLSRHVPPSSSSSNASPASKSESSKRWQQKPGRNPKGYWNRQRVLVELYKFVEDCKDEMGRPSCWMPKPMELSARGRDDLKGALARFGGHKAIGEEAGLVSSNEWTYFELQYRLFLELRDFLADQETEEFCFPQMTDVPQSLYDLVTRFGGRKFVASRLGIALCRPKHRTPNRHNTEMIFGAFSLDFAIRLFAFIRQDQMLKRPPLVCAGIQMPDEKVLVASGEHKLAEEVEKYGGYDSIARRLHLAIF